MNEPNILVGYRDGGNTLALVRQNIVEALYVIYYGMDNGIFVAIPTLLCSYLLTNLFIAG